jgi:Ankyrin repeats (3 copies)/ATP synthase alpha/beta family, nucleotide-binding domain/Ankyrin repeat
VRDRRPGSPADSELDYTPLLFAANYGQRDLAEVLLRHGANPNVHLRGETPLGRAVLMHDDAMLDLLLHAGADPSAVLLNGLTPLHRAAMRGHAAIARRLLDAGANRGAQDANGRTPGDWAVLDGRQEVAALPGATLPAGSGAEGQPLARDVLETGIKVVDVMTPLPRGGTIRTTAQGGVGKMVLLAEIVHRLARRGGRAVFVRWHERFYRAEDAVREQMEAGVDQVSELVLGHMDATGRIDTLQRAADRAEALRDENGGSDVLLLVDAPPEGELPLANLRDRVGVHVKGSITLLAFDLLLPNTGYARAPVDDAEWDVQLVFDRVLAKRGVYPAIDPVASRSRLLDDGRVPPEHAAIARDVRDLLRNASDANSIRAQRVIEFQSQPFYVAEPWTARPGAFVPVDAAQAGYRTILTGAADAFAEGALLYAGAFPSRPS